MDWEDDEDAKPEFEKPFSRAPQHVERESTEHQCAEKSHVIELEPGNHAIKNVGHGFFVDILQKHVEQS